MKAMLLTMLCAGPFVPVALAGQPEQPLPPQPPAASPQPGSAEKGEVPAVLNAEPLEPKPGDDELHKLLKARYNAALAVVQEHFKFYLQGRVSPDVLFEASRRLLEAELALSDRPADQVAVREKQLDLARHYEKIQELLVSKGRGTRAALEEARYFRIDAEIQLLEAKRRANPGGG